MSAKPLTIEDALTLVCEAWRDNTLATHYSVQPEEIARLDGAFDVLRTHALTLRLAHVGFS